MNKELVIFIALQAMLLCLVVEIWRGAKQTEGEFFPSRRAEMLRSVRWRLSALFIVMISGLSAGYLLNNQRLQQLRLQETLSSRYADELLKLRVEYAMAINQLRREQQAEAALALPAASPVETPPAAQARITRLRAVLRDAPDGAALATLAPDTAVQALGEPVSAGERSWQQVSLTDQRTGWIASELLAQRP